MKIQTIYSVIARRALPDKAISYAIAGNNFVGDCFAPLAMTVIKMEEG